MNKYVVVIAFALIWSTVIAVIFFSPKGKTKYETMCEQTKGTPVHNGKNWECWK